MALISVHFDGPITVDHKVPIRVLANTYEHLQRAIDRAFLIETFGDVYKHQRLTGKQYAETVFIAEYPREGGIILDAVKKNGGKLVDRLANSIRPIFENALDKGLVAQKDLTGQFLERQAYVIGMKQNTMTYPELLRKPPPVWKDAYSNRAVVKEIDQLVSQITPRALEGSTVDIKLIGEDAHLPFQFDAGTARRFHKIASQKELGAPVIVNCIIRSIDRGNRTTKPSAKIYNIATQKEVTLQCFHPNAAEDLIKHFDNEPVLIFATPFIEALGFDVMAGDLVFVGIVD